MRGQDNSKRVHRQGANSAQRTAHKYTQPSSDPRGYNLRKQTQAQENDNPSHTHTRTLTWQAWTRESAAALAAPSANHPGCARRAYSCGADRRYCCWHVSRRDCAADTMQPSTRPSSDTCAHSTWAPAKHWPSFAVQQTSLTALTARTGCFLNPNYLKDMNDV